MGHRTALWCGDIISKSSRAAVLVKFLALVKYFNSSYAKKLEWLREEMQDTYGSVWTLYTFVVTRRTSTWTALISGIRVQLAFQRLALSP